MRLIKGYGNSLFFVNNENEIIEYNVLIGKKRSHFYNGSYISNYYVENCGALVVVIYRYPILGHVLYWNNKIHVIEDRYCPYFLKTALGLASCVSEEGKRYLFFNDGQKIDYTGNYRYILSNSYNCKKIIILCVNSIYVVNLTKWKPKYTYEIGGPRSKKINSDYHWENLHFISNSNRLVVWTPMSADPIKNQVIQNIETDIRGCIDISIRTDDIYDTKHGVIIGIVRNFMPNQNKIFIYNAETIALIKVINNGINFIGYNKRIDVLITCKFEHYRINSRYDLEAVIVGHNYRVDQCCAWYTNPIMDVILDTNMLFDSIPDEILNIELYRQILLLCLL